jgi:hypothetical protein
VQVRHTPTYNKAMPRSAKAASWSTRYKLLRIFVPALDLRVETPSALRFDRLE